MCIRDRCPVHAQDAAKYIAEVLILVREVLQHVWVHVIGWGWLPAPNDHTCINGYNTML